MLNNTKPKVLVDSDILIYKAAFSVEGRYYTDEFGNIFLRKADCFDDRNLTLHREVKDDVSYEVIIHSMFNSLRENFPKHEIVFVMGTKWPSYRKAMYPKYKANRTSDKKPILFEEVSTYLEQYPITKVYADAGFEVDDKLGELSINNIIASVDKDLLSIPGNHYNLTKHEKFEVVQPGKVWIDPYSRTLKGYGFKWLCAQILCGDKADNIPGIKKMLLKSILEIINFPHNSMEDMFLAVENLYSSFPSDRRELSFEQALYLVYIQGPHPQFVQDRWSEIHGRLIDGTFHSS